MDYIPSNVYDVNDKIIIRIMSHQRILSSRFNMSLGFIPSSSAIRRKLSSSVVKKPNLDFCPARLDEKGYFTMLSAVFIGLAQEEHTEKAGEKKAIK